MSSTQDEDMSFIDEEESSSSTARNVQSSNFRFFNVNSESSTIKIANNSQESTESNSGSKFSGYGTGMVTMASSSLHSPAIFSKTQNVPNVGDVSDAESVTDNARQPVDKRASNDEHLIPALDVDYLNNLDKGPKKGPGKDDKYLIPEITDLHYLKKQKSTGALAASLHVEDMHQDFTGLSHSESMSSVRSEQSSGTGGGTDEMTCRRNSGSDGLASTSGTGAHSVLRKSVRKRRRSSLRPCLKNNFAELTIQYIKDRIEGRVFSGWLEERQRVEGVVQASSTGTGMVEVDFGMRDVVEVDSCDLAMIQQLDAVMTSVPGAKAGKKWINIKAPGLVQGYLLYLQLPEAWPPAHYWFQVQRVTCDSIQGLQLHLKLLRPVDKCDTETAEARRRRLDAAARGDVHQSLTQAWEDVLQGVRDTCTTQVLGQHAALLLQPRSIAHGIRVVVLALVSVTVAVAYAAREAARLFLQLMRESANLIDRTTPAFHIIVNFIEKIIGGCMVMLAMVYRDIRRQPAPPQGGAGATVMLYQGAGAPVPPPALSYPSVQYSKQTSGRQGPPNYGSARQYVRPEAWDYGDST